MKTPAKTLPAKFFTATSGRMPVREWLLELGDTNRKIVGGGIADVEYGWPVGAPLCKHMGGGLFEVRSNLADKRISRVFFVPSKGRMVLLHAFIKKTKQTPKAELDLARKRAREVER